MGMNRRERKAQEYAARKAARTAKTKDGDKYMVDSTDNNARDQIVNALEGILVGLFSGTKKLVIESVPQRYYSGMGFEHTFKVVDINNGTATATTTPNQD
jgi:hypothetical protein